MNQSLALEVMLSGESVLLTGPAGSGKTYVLNRFIQFAKSDARHVSVTATTGLAATHLGGTTIHSWSGIGIHNTLPSNFIDHLSKSRRDIIQKTDVLIIDEISMLHDYRLDMIDEICRAVKEKDQPFGGIQIILSGDFFQLPPINRNSEPTGGFVVESEAWRELDPVICYLSEQHRQDDEKLLGILDALRRDDLRRHHAECLLERIDIQPGDGHVFTELHTVNVDVDTINQARLAELPGDEMEYTQATTGSANYVEALQRSILAPGVLLLKKGAVVMALKNSLEHKYVNGSIGTVVDFEPETGFPIVEFINGRTVNMLPDTWELRDGDKKRASISQIPLRLAWAITVHKSQGMTLDSARIDLRKAFVEGMGYVALSRVKNLNSLYLVGINRKALKASGEAIRLDGSLQSKSGADAKRFAYLEKKTQSRKLPTKLTKKPGGNSWSEKIAKMREAHPNAYKPWLQADDITLKQDFLQGKTIEEMSKRLGRHEGSIKMRLQKHFGEDVVSS